MIGRWLATLLLPPKREDGEPRRLLVPFSGSGSEMIGAERAGWEEILGIEADPHSCAVARARLAPVEALEAKPRTLAPIAGPLFL